MSLCIDCCVNLKVKSCLWKLLPVIGTSITSAKWTPAASCWSTDGQIQSGSQECHSADHSPAASQSPCCPGTLFISFFLLSRSVCVYLLKKLNGFLPTLVEWREHIQRCCVYLYVCIYAIVVFGMHLYKCVMDFSLLGVKSPVFAKRSIPVYRR